MCAHSTCLERQWDLSGYLETLCTMYCHICLLIASSVVSCVIESQSHSVLSNSLQHHEL